MKRRKSSKLSNAGYKTHLEALGKLKELERERVERDKLNAEIKRVETALVNVKADQKRNQEKLESALKAHQEIKELEPKVEEQTNWKKNLIRFETRWQTQRRRRARLKVWT